MAASGMWETNLGPDSADHSESGPGPLPGLLDGVSVDARPYQLRIASNAVRMFRGEHRNRAGELAPPAASVMIESPTGSGKTVMGLTVARRLQQEFGYSIGWVAMRRNLLSQAMEENARRGFDVEMTPISMFDKTPPAVDMLVVDEAQHDAAMSMANLHSMIKPKKVLGLTATPFRGDRIKLCFDQVITDIGIHQLIQDGYLSRYHHYTIPEYTPSSVAQTYLRDPQRWGKSLLFFHRLDQCRECAAELAAAGVQADVVTASSNRERQLGDFLAGKTNVLINMSILTEGFDCPALQTVFCRPSGKSCTIQMAGRVFRQHADLPVKQVVQCKKTTHPMIKTAMADEQYVWLDDTWRTLRLNARIAEISYNARRMIANAQVNLPKIVAAHRSRPLPWRRDRTSLD
ncbi:DEAD/DEAH box helicase [Lignipirellula cremea]|uniref:Type III restriction enzyme, res subunit n=1 Tax=Lignipirellula cremea TaxID=2528010 RepID=A0A518DTS6_9BACT|nr:DEAD/DEAH box helicase family protein [Lignipirellula cremea]QDU95234.1 Type III restriction enzyme, res subunit [Lignipirellula cremea]